MPTHTHCRAQEISLNYHMKGEQWVHSSQGGFFNFNGTAGVWRRQCIETSGGWSGSTTVEDMDLSLRAYLCGWKMLFLDKVSRSPTDPGPGEVVQAHSPLGLRNGALGRNDRSTDTALLMTLPP